MTSGNANRSVGETAMNATSSRSHSLFTVCIETSEPSPNGGDDRIKAGKLNLVDLAGNLLSLALFLLCNQYLI
jgi:hypothetical protein